MITGVVYEVATGRIVQFMQVPQNMEIEQLRAGQAWLTVLEKPPRGWRVENGALVAGVEEKEAH